MEKIRLKTITLEQKRNCLRLASIFDEISQDIYLKLYKANPIYFLQSDYVTKEFPSICEHIDKESIFEHLDYLFFDCDYLFLEHATQKWLIVDRLVSLGNFPKPKPKLYEIIFDWLERKLCCSVQFDP